MTEPEVVGDKAPGDAPISPVWPVGKVRVLHEDTEVRTVTLDLRSSNLNLGDISGWQVTLTNTRSLGPLTMDAQALDGSTTVVLGDRVNRTTATAPGVTLELTSSGQRVALAGPVEGVRFQRGRFTVNGTDAYTAWVPIDDGETVIEGSAPLRSLNGGGAVGVSGGFAPGPEGDRRPFVDGFAGTIKVAGTLERLKADRSDVTIEADGVTGCEFSMARILVNGPVRDSDITATERVWVREAHGSNLRVIAAPAGPGLVAGQLEEERGALTLDDELLVPEESTGISVERLRAEDQEPSTPQPVAFTGGSVTDCTLVCGGEGDVYVGDTARSALKVARTLLCRGDLAVEAKGDVGALVVGSRLAVQGALTYPTADAVEVHGTASIGGRVDGGAFSAAAASLGGLTGTAVTTTKECTVKGDVIAGSVEADDVTFWGVVEGTAIKAKTAMIGSDLRAAVLTIEHDLIIRDDVTADASTTTNLSGGGIFPKGYGGDIAWSPTLGTHELKVKGEPGTVRIQATAFQASVRLDTEADVRWRSLQVNGSVSVNAESGFAWNVGTTNLVTNKTVLTVRTAGDCNVGKIVAVPGATLAAPDPTGQAFGTVAGDVGAATGIVLLCDAPMDVAVPEGNHDTEITISGSSTVRVHGDVRAISSTAAPAGPWPALAVPEDGVVNDLRGHVRLGAVEGRIDVQPNPDEGWSLRVTGVLRRLWPHERTAGTAPIIHDIAPPGTADAGQVVGVDPSEVPYASLANAASLHVFGPDADVLMDWAAAERVHDHEHRTVAVKAQRIAEQVKSSAASGGARSSAQWAAARAHHRAIPQRSKVERLLRTAHRSLGYSQRPGPAALTFVISVALWTILTEALHLTEYEIEGIDVGHYDGAGGIAALAVRIASLPFSWLLRLPEDEGAAAFFRQHWVAVLAFLSTGLPFVFFVIALRNFMAPPAARDRS